MTYPGDPAGRPSTHDASSVNRLTTMGSPAWRTSPARTPPQVQRTNVLLGLPAAPRQSFAPVSATNPMCVVDSMRFPYIDGTG